MTRSSISSQSVLLMLIGSASLCLAGCGGQATGSARAEQAASTSAAHTAARTHSQNQPVIPMDARAAGVANFRVVHPFLLRGAAPTPEGLKSLKALGVRTIFDLRARTRGVRNEEKLAQKLGINDIDLPMSADPPSDREVKTFLSTVTNPADQPVFVHCQYGADRTGCLVGIYRERYDHWSFPKTYREMRRYGFKPFLSKLKATVRANAPR